MDVADGTDWKFWRGLMELYRHPLMSSWWNVLVLHGLVLVAGEPRTDADMLPGFPMLWITLPGEERVLALKDDQAEGIWTLSEIPVFALGWLRMGYGHLQGGVTSLWDDDEAGFADMLREQLATSAGNFPSRQIGTGPQRFLPFFAASSMTTAFPVRPLPIPLGSVAACCSCTRKAVCRDMELWGGMFFFFYPLKVS